MWALVLIFWVINPEEPIKEMTVLNVLQFKSEEACHKRLYDILAMPDSKGSTISFDKRGQLQLLSVGLQSKSMTKSVCVKSKLDIYEEYK